MDYDWIDVPLQIRPLVLHIGTYRDVLRTSGRFSGTSSGSHFAEWVISLRRFLQCLRSISQHRMFWKYYGRNFQLLKRHKAVVTLFSIGTHLNQLPYFSSLFLNDVAIAKNMSGVMEKSALNCCFLVKSFLLLRVSCSSW